MKTRKFIPFLLLLLFLSGCVVYSFYPLYTKKDLFPNDILTGQWLESNGENTSPENSEGIWTFEHPFINENESDERDSLSYVLTVKQNEEGKVLTSVFNVHIIELGDAYFLDFYLRDFPDDGDFSLGDFHLVPVHTFAKLSVTDNGLYINWFDPEWLEDLVRKNKIRIHHEANDDFILLTAKTNELQKFVSKYVNSEEAFDNGLQVELIRAN